MSVIAISAIVVPPDQRELNPAQLGNLVHKMTGEGYNASYPITLERDNGTYVLVDGGHRIEAARQVGIQEVPFLLKPEGVSRIRHSIRCNTDGADTRPDDVFDYASRIAELSKVMTGQQIAEELGWSADLVSKHKLIRERLHPRVWELARVGSTKNDDFVDVEADGVVDSSSTKVDWSESHLRSLIQYLPCPNGDRALMRAQVGTIRELLGRKTFTAKIVGEVAQRYAWHTALAKQMTVALAREVGASERVKLLRNVRNNVYGKKESDRDLTRFAETLAALNERALGVKLFCDDALQRIPLFEDKSFSLVIVDPPYNVTDHAWDDMGTDTQYLDWTSEWLEALRPKLADDYHLFVFCDPDYAAPIEMLLRGAGWPIKSRIIWEYRNLVKGRDVTDKFIENWQMCFHCGTHALNWPPQWDDSRFMVQNHATPQSNFSEGKHHPTAKPLDLYKLFVNIGSKPGDMVLDPFAGGGTTGQACSEVSQRRCVLIEQSNDYCQVIENRLGIKRGVE